MSTKITYKGNEIANITTDATKTLKTQGKYCEGDIIVQNTQDGGSEPTLITKSITENGTYNATDDNADGYSSVSVNVAGGGGDDALKNIIQGTCTGEVTINGLSKIKENTIVDIGSSTKIYCDCPVINSNNFMRVSTVTEIYLSSLVQQNNYNMYSCMSLQKIDYGSLTNFGGSGQFEGTAKLDTIIIRTASVCTMKTKPPSTTTFIKGTGYFYVPRNLVEDYKVATNWSDFADTNQIRAIEDYPDITGG